MFEPGSQLPDLHVKLGSQDVEKLDTMMDGQSHRARLNATVRGDDSQPPPAFSSRGGPSTRGGRGGGVMGTRGRGGSTSSRQYVMPCASMLIPCY